MNLEEKIQFYLSGEGYAIVQKVGILALALKQPVYLVGGAVRDVILGRQSLDLDFVTEGSGIKLAEIVCKNCGGTLTTHERFGTAVWTPPADQFAETIDFITARKEVYKAPAALPDVTASSMQDDLFRRDFAINAMAIRLDGDHFGQLLDPFNGMADLEQRKIRILHDKSFDDDPTRMFRGARYAGRLGFELTADTSAALNQSLPMLKELSADRVRHEIEKILEELLPIPMLDLLSQWSVLDHLSIPLKFSDLERVALTKLDGLVSIQPGFSASEQTSLDHLRLATWFLNSQSHQTTPLDLVKEMNCTADFKRDIERVLAVLEQAKSIADYRPGTIEKLLRGTTATQLVLLQAHHSTPHELRAVVPNYFNRWRSVETNADGNTLLELGVPPGPSYQKILDQLLADKLNGDLQTDAAESERLTELISQFAP